MATHSSILAWRIPWTEEPGGLQSMGSQRVRHNRVTDSAQPQKRSRQFPGTCVHVHACNTHTRTCTRTLAHSPQGSAPPSAGGALPHSHLLLLPPQPHDHCRTRPLLQNHPLLETLPGPPTPQLCLPPAGRGLTENRMGQERVFCGPVNGLPSPQTALYFSLPFCLWQVGLVLLFTINLLFWLLRRKR